MTNIELSRKQCEYINNSTHRWNFKIGATQCGKTHIDVAFIIPDRILQRKNQKGLNLILGVTKETIERNVLEPMRDIWGSGLVGEINSRNVCRLFGEKVYCLGAEKISQVAKLRGAKFKYVYIDEIVDINEEVFQLLKSRLSLPYSVCDATGNPSFPNHYIKEFIDGKADVYCQNWTIYDNPFLDPKVINELEREYEGTVYYDRYILGLWVKAEGLIFGRFSKKHIAETVPRQYEKYQVSIDYGTENPCVFLLWGLYRGVWYCVKEYYYDGRKERYEKTDGEYYDELVKFTEGLKIDKVIVDPSAKSFIVLIRRKGFVVVDADNSVQDGLRNSNSALNMTLILFNDCCKNTLKEFGLYIRDPKSTKEEPLKENDHAMDAFRYFVQTNRIAVPKRKSLID